MSTTSMANPSVERRQLSPGVALLPANAVPRLPRLDLRLGALPHVGARRMGAPILMVLGSRHRRGPESALPALPALEPLVSQVDLDGQRAVCAVCDAPSHARFCDSVLCGVAGCVVVLVAAWGAAF